MEQTNFDFNQTLLETHDFDIDTIIHDQNSTKLNYDILKRELHAVENKNEIRWINKSNHLLTILEGNTFDGFHQLIDLDLSYNILTFLPKCVFDQLFNMQILNLSHNLISELEDSMFKNNKQLRIINLSNNLITEINSRTFDNLHLLRKLDFSYNMIKKLSETCMSSEFVQELNLSYNQITYVSNFAFKFVPNLIHLQLNNNKIVYLTRNLLKNTTKIENLNLSNNFIRKLEKRTFGYLNNLRKIDLSNNLLSTFGKCFLNKPILKEINLLNNQINIFWESDISLSNNISTLKLTIHGLLNLESFANLTLLSDFEFHIKINEIYTINQFFLSWINAATLQKLYLVIRKGIFNVNYEISMLFNLEFLHIEFLEPINQSAIFDIWFHINIMTKLKHLALVNINRLTAFSNIKSNYNILTYLNLTGIYSTSIDFLRNNAIMLEYLNLSVTQIRYISQDLLSTLPNLKYLIMNGTRISIIENDLFQYNSKLEIISFKNCQIKIIGENSFRYLENLKVIDIRGNKLLRITQYLLNGIPKSAMVYY